MKTSNQQQFNFFFYRFNRDNGKLTTELVRNASEADGMKSLIINNSNQVAEAVNKVEEWAKTHGITLKNTGRPYPSAKHPGKAWLDFRFGGLTL